MIHSIIIISQNVAQVNLIGNALGHVSNKLVRVIFKILTHNIPFNLS